MAGRQSDQNIFPFQQIAVKLYEKDPSKLTSMDEPLPNVSTSSDLSDEEDSNLAGPDIKEEPVEVVPNITAGVRGSPSIRQAEAGPRLGDRQSYSSSGQEDPSTDSDTVRLWGGKAGGWMSSYFSRRRRVTA